MRLRVSRTYRARSCDELVVEGVVVGDDHHGVGLGHGVGGQLDEHERHVLGAQVGVGHPDVGAELGQVLGDGDAPARSGRRRCCACRPGPSSRTCEPWTGFPMRFKAWTRRRTT